MSDASLARSKVSFREITADDQAGLEVISGLHMELLGYGPMAGLGERFVREICYRAHMQDELLRVTLATVDGRPAGFVAYTPYSASFHRSGLGRHLLRAGFETALAILSRPSRLIKLVRALKVLGSRREEHERVDDTIGEVVCIAVRPEYLKPTFARSSGVRPSETLVSLAATYLRRAGREQMRMLVDADNRPVLMLYHLLGAHFTPYALGGEPMVEVDFDLSQGRLAAAPDVPASWAGPGTGSTRPAAGTWRNYWEDVTERRRVFEAEAEDHVLRLRKTLPGLQGARALDFGCGFGYTARFLAPYVRRIALWDGSATVRERARLRTAHLANVEYADLADGAGNSDARYDLITAHSVVQYMSEDELRGWLGRWRVMLAPGGRLVLSDLLQPATSSAHELLGYLVFSLRKGFLWEALLQGVRETAAYFRTRATRPLMQVTPERLQGLAAEAGLRVEFLPHNLSYRRSRVSAILRV